MQNVFYNDNNGLKTQDSPITVGPVYLVDASNIVFSKNGYIQSRHGHTFSKFLVHPTISTRSPFLQQGGTIFRCMEFFYNPSTKAGQYLIRSGVTQANDVTVYGRLWNVVHASNPTYTAFPQDSIYTENLNYSPNVWVNRKPRFFVNKQNNYCQTNFGLKWEYIENRYDNFQFPTISKITPTISAGSDPDARFIVPGNRFGIAVTILYNTEPMGVSDTAITNERLVESEPYFATVNDTFVFPTSENRLTCSVQVNFNRIPIWTDLNGATRVRVRIYRTLQVAGYTVLTQNNEVVATQLPVQYYQAAPDIELTNALSVNFNLNINDDGIRGLPQLYTNPNIEGIENGNTHIRGTKNVTNFKNYFFYSNINDPGYQVLTMTSVPPDTTPREFYIFQRQVGGSYTTVGASVPWPFVKGNVVKEVNTTATPSAPLPNYVESSLSYTGFGGPYTFTLFPNSNKGGVQPDARAVGGSLSAINGSGQIVLTGVGQFNPDKFKSPGIAAATKLGGVARLFTYRSYTINSPTQITFNECRYFGIDAFLDDTEFLYYIPGENAESLPVYISVGNPLSSVANGQLSLLPTIGCPSVPIGVIARSTSNSPPWENVGGALRGNMFWFGIKKRPSSQLLDDTVTKLVESLNTNTGGANQNVGMFEIRKLPEVGSFSISPKQQIYEFTTYQKSTSDFEFLPKVSNIEATAFSRNYTTSSNLPNGVYISKLNTPEVMGYQYFLEPLEVGSREEAIVASVANTDSLFFLKEKSVWRLTILNEGSTFLNKSDVATFLVDPTTGCVGTHSVQEINEEIIWLSESGFVSINGGQIESIGRDIEDEVKNAISICQTNGLTEEIRSFANEQKRLYGCFIPTSSTRYPLTGITYVFDTFMRKWAKWDFPFDFAQVDEKGRLLTMQTLYDNAGNWDSQYQRIDKFTNGQNENPVDQYDMDETLAGTNAPTTVSGGFASLFKNGTTLTLPVGSTTNSLEAIGRLGYFNRFNTSPWSGYYYDTSAATLYPILVQPVAGNQLSIQFTEGAPAQTAQDDRIIKGIPALTRYQPFVGSDPTTLKQFSEYHIHTDGAVHGLKYRFITDSRSTYTNYRTFSTFVTNRTVYRSYIPTEACRGRWLIREVSHDYPGEYLKMVGQEMVYRELGSTRNQLRSS